MKHERGLGERGLEERRDKYGRKGDREIRKGKRMGDRNIFISGQE